MSDGGEGGGAFGSRLTNCVLRANSASLSQDGTGGGTGGGARSGKLINSLVAENQAFRGGGTYGGTLINCTSVGNSAYQGGGSYNTCHEGCIVYFNSAQSFPNFFDTLGQVNSSCTTPLPSTGTGNITNSPLFVDTNDWADLRLQSNSPCINSGNNTYVATTNDLDGNPRIVGGTVDMGAYEFQSPASTISYAYLQQYGLPADGSADHIDGDNDKATTWQEWKMWTIPTNDQSVLKMLSPDPDTNGTEVAWQSVDDHSYTLERATTNAANFTVLQSGIAGQSGMTTFTDTTATNGNAFFYRVSVPE